MTAYLFGFLSIYFILLFNFILAAKLVSFLPLIISPIFAVGYAYWWHRSTRKVLNKTSKPTRKDPYKTCAETPSLSITGIQEVLDHQEGDYFQKFLSSFSLASEFYDRIYFSKDTWYLLPDYATTLPETAKTSEGASSHMPKSSIGRQLSKYSCRTIISTDLAIKSFESGVRLIRLIEGGLKLRSNQKDYDVATQGELVAIDKTIVPSGNTRSY